MPFARAKPCAYYQSIIFQNAQPIVQFIVKNSRFINDSLEFIRGATIKFTRKRSAQERGSSCLPVVRSARLGVALKFA